jgi:hypothetical protein
MLTMRVIVRSCASGTLSQVLNALIIIPRISFPGLEVMYVNGSVIAYEAGVVSAPEYPKVKRKPYRLVAFGPILERRQSGEHVVVLFRHDTIYDTEEVKGEERV